MEHKLLPFEAVAGGWQDPVLLLNSSGAILWVNQAAATVVGRSTESVLSLKLTDILTPRSSEVADAALRSRIQGSPSALLELDFFRPDLSSCRLEVGLSVLAGVDPPALIAIGRDVSQRRLLDEQQRRADFQTLQFQVALLELARTESNCLEDFLFHVTTLAAATLDVARVSV